MKLVTAIIKPFKLDDVRQAPPGVRITPRGFGKDWRYPITSGFRPKS